MEQVPVHAGTYVPNDGLNETFADHTQSVAFDGANFRIELTVGRLDSGPSGVSTKQHPVARLVLPLACATDLIARLNGTLAELEKRGAVQRRAVPGQQN